MIPPEDRRAPARDQALCALAAEARACQLCAAELPHAPRPVFQVECAAPILLVGQAPGRRVHESGIPWSDPSGERLRGWLGVGRAVFYDPRRFAILPSGLCYPGTERGKGDRPPLPRCAPTWHPQFLALLEPSLRLRLLVGAYAIAHHLPEAAGLPVGDVVRDWRRHLRFGVLPLPHPSPRNRRWLADRPWFEGDVVPALRREVADALAAAHLSADDEARAALGEPDRHRPRATPRLGRAGRKAAS